MWVWRDDVTPGVDQGGWRLDAYGTWTWDEPSSLDRAGAGTSAVRGYSGPGEPRAARPRERVVAGPGAGDRALAAVGALPAEYTPIFHALTEDRTRRYDDRWAGARVPEPHPGSGALPVQDSRGALSPVPTVPPPPADGLGAVSAEEELRRRAERRRRPRSVEQAPAGGRHTLLPRDEPQEGRHVLRR